MKSSPLAFVATLGLTVLFALPRAHAAPAKTAKPAASAKTAANASKAAANAPKKPSMGQNKEEIEAYLKERLAAIRSGSKAQTDFNASEGQAWQDFWAKVKDERELFEVRVAKQRLNVFESLDSLERAEHGKTIADFERMQSNVLRSFEAAQKAKMTAFFAGQAERTKAFAAQQEKDRASFAEDAEASWRQLKLGRASAPATKP